MAKRTVRQRRKQKAGTPAGAANVTWLRAFDKRFTMRGLWWREENEPALCRLPMRAKGVVRDPVWELAQCTAGARLCFKSDTTTMRVKCTLRSNAGFPHMPLTGHSGLDLYLGGPYRQRPMAVGFPQVGEGEFERVMFEKIPPRMREYTLYLPLYNGVKSLSVGLSRGARVARPSRPVVTKPAVFYGTSITQGGCAHTAGADYVSILGRMLNLDIINLGFSGNGRGEPEMARFISEIDASLFALDYVANAGQKVLQETLPGFVDILRAAHPATPIVLISKVVYAPMTFSAETRAAHEAMRDTVIHFYSDRRRAGDNNIHFVDGDHLMTYGAQSATADGGHPTSVGFLMMAEALAPRIEQILNL